MFSGHVRVSISSDLPSLCIADEAHNENVFAHLDGLWTSDVGGLKTLEITHFLFGPYADHFSGIMTAIKTKS